MGRMTQAWHYWVAWASALLYWRVFPFRPIVSDLPTTWGCYGLKWDAGCKRITSTVKHYTNVKKYYYFYFQTNQDSAFINFQHAPHQDLGQGQEHSLLKMHSPWQIMVGRRQQQQAINQAAVVSGRREGDTNGRAEFNLSLSFPSGTRWNERSVLHSTQGTVCWGRQERSQSERREPDPRCSSNFRWAPFSEFLSNPPVCI